MTKPTWLTEENLILAMMVMMLVLMFGMAWLVVAMVLLVLR